MFDNYFCFIFKSFFFLQKKKNVWLAWEKMISKIKHKICLVIVFEPFHLEVFKVEDIEKDLEAKSIIGL